MKTTVMKSQMLYHNNYFPTINFRNITKSSSSFNNPPPPYHNTPAGAFVGKRNLNLSSSKTEHWVIKSHHKEQHITVDYTSAAEDANVVDDGDDDARETEKELKSSTRSTSMQEVLITGAVSAASIGILVVLMGQDDKAWALGPEGPMVEEFWENVRRYGLYALTVSTGVLYAVLQPIVELLKNPISAVLIILIFGGSFFIFSQILSAMFGVSDFDYQYAY